MTKKLTDYVNNLDESFTMEMLPYLEIDGHPSHIGYNLISDLINERLENKTFQNFTENFPFADLKNVH